MVFCLSWGLGLAPVKSTARLVGRTDVYSLTHSLSCVKAFVYTSRTVMCRRLETHLGGVCAGSRIMGRFSLQGKAGARRQACLACVTM